MAKTRIIVGLSGASGIIYGIRLLEAARELGVETDLIMTETAAEMIEIETSLSPEQVAANAVSAGLSRRLIAEIRSRTAVFIEKMPRTKKRR